MSINIKIDQLLKPFDGSNFEWTAWIQRFETVAAMSGWSQTKTEGKEYAAGASDPLDLVLPLFLTGDALTVYQEGGPVSYKDACARLQKAFTLSRPEALAALNKRRWKEGESVEAYFCDVKRLAGLAAGTTLPSDLHFEYFVNGLPREVAVQLRIQCMRGYASAIDIARVLVQSYMAERAHEKKATAGAATNSYCTKCKGVGHLAKHCRSTGSAGAPWKAQGDKTRKTEAESKCFACDATGHFKRNCPTLQTGGKAKALGVAAAGAAGAADVPRINVYHEQGRAVAAIDTGCSLSLIGEAFCRKAGLTVERGAVSLTMMDGSALKTGGTTELKIWRVDNDVHLEAITAKFVVVDHLAVLDADICIGSDIVEQVGGMSLRYSGGELRGVRFGNGSIGVVQHQAGVAGAALALATGIAEPPDPAKPIRLTDKDVVVEWIPGERFWQVEWVWKEGQPPAQFVGTGVGEYPRQVERLSAVELEQYHEAVEKWRKEGWLVEAGDHDVKGILPLMPVIQSHKTTPVRPVLNFVPLNNLIISHPGPSAPACGESIRKLRQMGTDLRFVDIEKAYLQLRIHPRLWGYQGLVFKQKTFLLTRMGFGLAIAPKALQMVVSFLIESHGLKADAYVDDIVTDTGSIALLRGVLSKWGFPTKDPETLGQARVLGLQTFIEGDAVKWRRAEHQWPTTQSPMTKRDVFAFAGRATGHAPVAGWLRPTCSLLKRAATRSTGESWDAVVPDEVREAAEEILRLMRVADPVQGTWAVPTDGVIEAYSDASESALGAVLRIGGRVVEDGCWLTDPQIARHINLHELDAAIKTLQLASRYGRRRIHLYMDSKAAFGWVRQVVQGERRLRVKGMNETLVLRRLGVIRDMLAEFETFELSWLPSEENPADALTRPRVEVKAGRGAVASAAVAVVPDKVSLEVLAELQARDPDICKMMSGIGHEQSRKGLVVEDGVLYRYVKLPPDREVLAPVAPVDCARQWLQSIHVDKGHVGMHSLLAISRRKFFCTNQAALCLEIVLGCTTCLQQRNDKRRPAPLVPPVVADRPCQVVFIDCLQLSHPTLHGVVVIVDALTRWAEAYPITSPCATESVQSMERWIHRWGRPDIVRCDRGLEFMGGFQVFCEENSIEVRRSSARHPQSQGVVERLNRSIVEVLRRLDGVKWEGHIERAMAIYWSRPHAGLGGMSPREAMFGWEAEAKFGPQLRSAWFHTTESWMDSVELTLAQGIDWVVECNSHDPQPDLEHPFEVGQRVLLKNGDRVNKLLPPWQAGFKIVKVIGPRSAVVQKGSGRELIANIDSLAPDPEWSKEAPEGQPPGQGRAAWEAGDVPDVATSAVPEPPPRALREASRGSGDPGHYRSMLISHR